MLQTNSSKLQNVADLLKDVTECYRLTRGGYRMLQTYSTMLQNVTDLLDNVTVCYRLTR